MSLYVYCIGDDLQEAAFEGVEGVGRAPVRLLGLGRVAAVVSDVGEEPTAVKEENLLAHNRVNAAALARSTPLPCRFGTRAAPEHLAEYAATNEAALLAALARVRGCVEMSVKIMLKAAGKERKAKVASEGAGLEEVGRRAPPESSADAGKVVGATAGDVELDSARAGRGTAFLLQKRRELMGEEEERRRAEESGAWLAAAVAGLALETAARVSPSEAIVARAAHLIERARVAEYRARLRAHAAVRADLHLLTSGPWPPYSFADIGRATEARP